VRDTLEFVVVKLPYFLRFPFALFVAGLTLIAFAPGVAEWAETNAVVSGLMSALETVFFPIRGYTLRSNFPQVTRLYFSLFFLLSPVHFLMTLRELENSQESWALRLRNIQSLLQVGHRLLQIVLALSISMFGYFVNPGYDFNLLPINSSMGALALVGFLFAGGIASQALAYAGCNAKYVFHYLAKRSARRKSGIPTDDG
jgi:hypothetical protein